MAEDTEPAPANLVWTCGLVLGMTVDSAAALGESARVDTEPAAGPFAARVVGGLVFVVWLGVVAWFVRWSSRRRWVREWFAAAERGRSRP